VTSPGPVEPGKTLIVCNGLDYWVVRPDGRIQSFHLDKPTDNAFPKSALIGILNLADATSDASITDQTEFNGHRVIVLRVSQGTQTNDTVVDASTFLVAASIKNMKKIGDPTRVVSTTTLYTDYKRIDGLMVPMRAAATQEGQLQFDVRVMEVEFLDKVDPAMFVAPVASPATRP
jgi:hypothetical protein